MITELSTHCDSTIFSNLPCLRVCTRSCHFKLLSYVIVMLELDRAIYTLHPWNTIPTVRYACIELSTSCWLSWKAISILREQSYLCFRQPLASSFPCLMSSLNDYVFMKFLDKCVVIIISILSSCRVSIECMLTNTILAPRWFVLSLTNIVAFTPTQTWSCFVLSFEFLANSAYVIFYLGVLLSFLSRMWWALLHLLRILDIVILLAITIRFLAPCCF